MWKYVRMKVKICLVGDPAVGKTSLIRRYVSSRFDDSYRPTLHAEFATKRITLNLEEEGLKVDLTLILWDIVGDMGMRQLLKEAYFFGAQGILAVCDVTRRATLEDLRSWWRSVMDSVGKVPWVVAVNKSDLRGRYAFSEERMHRMRETLGAQTHFTSAKTGDGVEEAFEILGSGVVRVELAKSVDVGLHSAPSA